MEICYVEKNFNKSSLKIIGQADAICREYRRQDEDDEDGDDEDE